MKSSELLAKWNVSAVPQCILLQPYPQSRSLAGSALRCQSRHSHQWVPSHSLLCKREIHDTNSFPEFSAQRGKKRLKSVWNVCWKQNFCLGLLSKINFLFQCQIDVHIESGKYLLEVLCCLLSVMYRRNLSDLKERTRTNRQDWLGQTIWELVGNGAALQISSLRSVGEAWVHCSQKLQFCSGGTHGFAATHSKQTGTHFPMTRAASTQE